MKGKIILIPVPYTDLTAAKLRPALVIFEGRQDLIVAAITTSLVNASEFDVFISNKYPDFNKTGLKAPSVLKLTKISTVRKDLAEGELGDIQGNLRDEVNDLCSLHLFPLSLLAGLLTTARISPAARSSSSRAGHLHLGGAVVATHSPQ
jgi:mRNA interferase MazF